jgi:GNAT superfamily N-acetyltransferase
VDPTADIEATLVPHWSMFGRWPGGALHDDGQLTWYENPVRSVPYNGVIATRLPGAGPHADRAIESLRERIAARGADMIWLVTPSSTPHDLAARLTARGVAQAEHIAGMALDLDTWTAPPLPDGVDYSEVLTPRAVAAYAQLTADYWSVPGDERRVVHDIHSYWTPSRLRGVRYLAWADGVPVGKGYLSLAGSPGVAAIYGMSVLRPARGRGVASGLTTVLLHRARRAGCRRVVLHSTPGARRMYARAGFREHCEIGLHATTELFHQPGAKCNQG